MPIGILIDKSALNSTLSTVLRSKALEIWLGMSFKMLFCLSVSEFISIMEAKEASSTIPPSSALADNGLTC